MGHAIPVRADYTAGEVRRLAQRAKAVEIARPRLTAARKGPMAKHEPVEAKNCLSLLPDLAEQEIEMIAAALDQLRPDYRFRIAARTAVVSCLVTASTSS